MPIPRSTLLSGHCSRGRSFFGVGRPGREGSNVHISSADVNNVSLYLYSIACFLGNTMKTLLGIFNVCFSYEGRQALT